MSVVFALLNKTPSMLLYVGLSDVTEMDARLGQLRNASLPILVTLWPIRMPVKLEQNQNAWLSIFVTFEPIVTLFRFEQFQNA